MTAQRVLIVGWDGGSWRVFRPLAEKGLMPRLKSLMESGAFGVMTSTIPPVTPPAWTTLLTGLRPERHGIFGFMEGVLLGDTRRDVLAKSAPVSALSLKHTSVLDILGDAGRKLMCINVPMTYPPRPINGIMITGMLTPADAETFTYPAELAKELTDYAIDLVHSTTVEEHARRASAIDDVTWVRRSTEIVRSRADNICRLGTEHPWDFGICIFTGPDRIFHRFWPEVMELVERGAATSEMEKLLLGFFAELDAALGRLVDAFGDAVVMVTSDHGFGPRAERTVYPDVWLERKGFLVRHAAGKARPFRRGVRRLVRRAMEAVLPRSLSEKVLRKAADRQTRLLATLDKARSAAYFMSIDMATYGGVRLVGEFADKLDASARARLIDEVISSVEEMRDPATGEAVLVRACRREELLPGAPETLLPEIILEFREGYTGRSDPLATELIGERPQDDHIGVHRIEGMFVLAGGPIRHIGETAPLHLADIAPTVLYLSGLPVHASMEGEVPLHLFDEAHVSSHPVETRDYGEPHRDEAAGEPGAAYTAEQEQQVKDHLRRLGYMD